MTQPLTSRAVMSCLLGLALVGWTMPVEAGDEGRRTIRSLPAPTSQGELEEIGARISGAVFPVRIVEDLGANYRPRHIEARGTAVLVRLGEDGARLLMPYGPLERASEVWVEVEGEELRAEVRYATVIFDMAMLDVGRGWTGEEGLALADDWPVPGEVFTVGNQAEQQAAVSGSSTLRPSRTPASVATLPDVHRGVIAERRVRRNREQTLHVYSPFGLANGAPLVTREGEVVALSSFRAAGGDGRVLAVPYEVIAEWYEGRERIDPARGGELAPEVRREEVETTVGWEALQGPRR